MRKWNKLHAGLALSIAVFLALGFWIVKPEAPDLPAYLSDSPDTDGVKAVRELLKERRGGSVKEWRRTWNELPRQAGQTLLVVQPKEAVTAQERTDLVRWMEQGNEVLLFDSQPAGWKQFSLNRKVDQSGWKGDAVKSAAGRQPSAITGYAGVGGKTMQAVVTSLWRIAPGKAIVPLLRDERGIVAARTMVGRGGLTVILEPEWLTNGLVLQHDHFALVRPLLAAPGGALWFDEYHHGLRDQPGLLAVYPAWLVFACGQLGLALLLWLWQRGKRLGPVYTPRAWVRRRGDETLLAVAGWYERRRFTAAALAHQRQQLRLLLQQRWGVRADAAPEEAAAAARGRWPAERAAQLARLLREEAPAPQGKAFVARSREISDMIDQLEKE